MKNGKKAVFLAFAAALILEMFVFDFVVAEGHSMEPSIRSGSVLIVSRLRYGIKLPFMRKYIAMWAQPKEGEVVIFYSPSGELVVKRCTRQAKDGKFFAQGDNELYSYDSRSYGSVPVGNIIGKVLGY